MIRPLTFLFLVVGLVWALPRVLRSVTTSSRIQPQRSVPNTDHKMVRDRVCNTFLARDQALRLTVGPRNYYFCSEACQQQFLSQN